MKGSLDTPLYQAYTKLFQKEISQVQEYSFDSDHDSYGTCILGVGRDFLDRFFSFTQDFDFSLQLKTQALSIIRVTQPNDFGFKVDWKFGRVSQITLYFRYQTPLTQRAYYRFFNHVIKNDWSGPPPSEIYSIFSDTMPFCFGLRAGLSKKLLYSAYIDTEVSGFNFKPKIQKLIGSVGWNKSIERLIVRDMNLLSPSHFRGCIGADSSGKVLKFDYVGLGLGRLFRFLRTKGVSENRIQEILLAIRELEQVRPNYFALKYGPDGSMGWKIYLAKNNIE